MSHQQSDAQRFKAEHSEYADLTDEVVEDTFDFQLWKFRQALDEVGRAFFEGVEDTARRLRELSR